MSWSEGPSFFHLGGVERGGFFLSSCVWCGGWIVHFPCKLFFWGILGSLDSFFFFWGSEGQIKLTHCEKKIELGRHLI